MFEIKPNLEGCYVHCIPRQTVKPLPDAFEADLTWVEIGEAIEIGTVAGKH